MTPSDPRDATGGGPSGEAPAGGAEGSSPPRTRVRATLVRLRTYLLSGILVTVPLLITGWVFYRFFLSMDGVLHVVPGSWEIHGLNIKRLLTSIPGLGALLTIGTVIAVGAATTNFVGRRAVSWTERLILPIPVLSTIYQGVKQLLEAVFSGESTRFNEVVYIEYPRRGIWSVGFVTGRTWAGANEIIGAECVNVFIPTTPNPTSGFYLMVPRDDVIFTDLTVEQAFKLIMSAGIVNPRATETKSARGRRVPLTVAVTDPGSGDGQDGAAGEAER